LLNEKGKEKIYPILLTNYKGHTKY